mmetsp:Transcript_5791/g.5382  ORF Transcript_5791/g.5382 Transcript_5791/m.5382 type:complete len:132 (-) Transcript_5791:409-804(-)
MQFRIAVNLTNIHRELLRTIQYQPLRQHDSLQIVLVEWGDQEVLIVEDIIDTGNTLTKFSKYLEAFGPKSIRVATLVEKRSSKACGFKGDFVGFSVPDDFIVGFCLDYNEHFRDLEHVAVLSDEAIRKYAK